MKKTPLADLDRGITCYQQCSCLRLLCKGYKPIGCTFVTEKDNVCCAIVIPAKAGIQYPGKHWMPVFTGMTDRVVTFLCVAQEPPGAGASL